MQANIPLRPRAALALLARLRTTKPSRASSDWEGILGGAMQAAIEALPEAFAPTLPEGEPEWSRPKPKALDAESVRDLFAVCLGLELDLEAERAAGLVSRYSKQVDPCRTIPDALKSLSQTAPEFARSRAFNSLWPYSSRCLLERSATPPEAPRDQRIEATIHCDSEHCEELKAFCLDRVATTKRFKAAQYVRSHIEISIRQANLDIEFRTESYSRPYTLVCEKVPKSYHRRVEIHAGDLDQMRTLSHAAPSGDSQETARALQRLHEAMALG